jgi:hypothetical protein
MFLPRTAYTVAYSEQARQPGHWHASDDLRIVIRVAATNIGARSMNQCTLGLPFFDSGMANFHHERAPEMTPVDNPDSYVLAPEKLALATWWALGGCDVGL